MNATTVTARAATIVGIDLAKSVFQLAVANAAWQVVEAHRLTARTNAKLDAAATDRMARIETDPNRVKSCFEDPGVKYAACIQSRAGSTARIAGSREQVRVCHAQGQVDPTLIRSRPGRRSSQRQPLIFDAAATRRLLDHNQPPRALNETRWTPHPDGRPRQSGSKNDQRGPLRSSAANGSNAIPRMLRRQAFVSPLVVAGDPGHELLCFTYSRNVEVDEEGQRSFAPNCCGDATVVKDLHVAALSDPSSEAQIVILFAGHSFADVRIHWVAGPRQNGSVEVEGGLLPRYRGLHGEPRRATRCARGRQPRRGGGP